MPNIKSYLLPDYETDFGDKYDLSFKVKENTLYIPNYTEKPDDYSGCTGSLPFRIRKAVLRFTDGSTMELPILKLTDVDTALTTFMAEANVICVGLKGEQWTNIPPKILGASPNSAGAEGAVNPSRQTYSFDYTLDGTNGDTINRKMSFETTPTAIFEAQRKCLENALVDSGIPTCFSQGFEPRHFIGRILNTSTGGMMSRKIIVSSNTASDIKKCGTDTMPSFNCLAYKGQSINNVANFYD